MAMDRKKALKRNAGFWLSKKINYPLVPPDTLQLSLTSRCNLRCKMCNVWEAARKEEELSFLEIKSVVDQCRQWGVEEVNLCGGEPLLSDICLDIISYAKESGMRVILTTNGTLLNEEMAKRLVDLKVDIITISLDGARPQTHDNIRGQQGAYDKIIQGIKNLNYFGKGSGPVKVLILTISNYNLDELEEYFSLAKTISADALYLTPVVLDNVRLYMQGAEDKKQDLWISGERLLKLDEVVDRLTILQKERYGLNYPSFRLLKKYFRGQVTAQDWVCFAGYRRFVLVPSGTVQMCGEAVGNIRSTPDIRKIWTSQAAYRRRRQIKKCRHFCLQDCHARQESATLRDIVQHSFAKQR